MNFAWVIMWTMWWVHISVSIETCSFWQVAVPTIVSSVQFPCVIHVNCMIYAICTSSDILMFCILFSICVMYIVWPNFLCILCQFIDAYEHDRWSCKSCSLIFISFIMYWHPYEYFNFSWELFSALYTFTYHILYDYTYHIYDTSIFNNNISHEFLSHTIYTVFHVLQVFWNSLPLFVTQSFT